MSTSGHRKLARAGVILIGGTVAVLTLSGCLSMTANLTIDSEAQTSGSFAIGLEKQAASMLGMTDLDTFASGIKSPDVSSGSGDLLSTGDCAASESDTEFIYTCTLSDADLAGGDNPWTVTKNGDSITFHMVNTATQSDEGDDLLQGGSLGTLNVNVTFPGEITSMTGEFATKTSDTSVAISSSMSDSVDVTVISKSSGATSGTLIKVLLIAGIAVLAIIVIVVIAYLVVRRRSDDEPPALATTETPAEALPQTDPPAQTTTDPTAEPTP